MTAAIRTRSASLDTFLFLEKVRIGNSPRVMFLTTQSGTTCVESLGEAIVRLVAKLQLRLPPKGEDARLGREGGHAAPAALSAGGNRREGKREDHEIPSCSKTTARCSSHHRP